MVKHVQDVAPHQHADNIWVKKDPGDLGKMEELFEKGRQREIEPNVELLIAKIGSIVRQLLSSHRLIIYQEDGDVVRDIEASSKLLLRQKIDWAFQPRVFGSHTLLTTFMASTARASGNNTPSR